MKYRDFLLGTDAPAKPAPVDNSPIIEKAPLTPPRDCVCGHSKLMHGPGGRGKCAKWKPVAEPGSCWCDGYEGSDSGLYDEQGNNRFPVKALEQPKDE